MIAEVFRKQKGVIRSDHPSVPYVAWGKNKEFIIDNHKLDYEHNEKSPLGKIYDLDGYVLLIGVGYDRNSSLHLAEYKANIEKKERMDYAPIIKNGLRQWTGYKTIDYDGGDGFIHIGEEFEKENSIVIGNVGLAEARLMNQREAVDFAASYMENHRPANVT